MYKINGVSLLSINIQISTIKLIYYLHIIGTLHLTARWTVLTSSWVRWLAGRKIV